MVVGWDPYLLSFYCRSGTQPHSGNSCVHPTTVGYSLQAEIPTPHIENHRSRNALVCFDNQNSRNLQRRRRHTCNKEQFEIEV